MFFLVKKQVRFYPPDSADQNLLRNSTPFFIVLLFSKNIILRKMGGIRRQSYKLNFVFKKTVNKYAIF